MKQHEVQALIAFGRKHSMPTKREHIVDLVNRLRDYQERQCTQPRKNPWGVTIPPRDSIAARFQWKLNVGEGKVVQTFMVLWDKENGWEFLTHKQYKVKLEQEANEASRPK